MDGSNFRSPAEDYTHSDDDISLEDVEGMGVFDGETRDGLMHEDAVEKEGEKRNLCRYQRCILKCLCGTICCICLGLVILIIALLAGGGFISEEDIESQGAYEEAMRPHMGPYNSVPSATPPLDQSSITTSDGAGVPTAAPIPKPPTPSFDDQLPVYTQEVIDKDPSSAQAKAYEWVTQHPEWKDMEAWRKKQLLALATFYYAYNGPNWSEIEKKHWLDYEINECQWGSFPNNYNECDIDDKLITLALESQRESITGTTPFEMELLPMLEKLEIIHMQLNTEFERVIPSKLASLEHLEQIRLSDSRISGTVPPYIGDFTQLTSLFFPSNDVVGPLPTEIGKLTALKYLNIHENHLSGTIPTELAQLTELVALSLFGNNFEGNLPMEICNMPSLLRVQVDCEKVTCPSGCDCDCQEVKESRETATPTFAPRTQDSTPYPTRSAEDMFALGLSQHTIDNMNDFNAPQFQAYGWLIQHPQLQNMTEARKQQLFGVVTFFESFSGAWTLLDRFRWLDFNVHECDWGLGTCDHDDQFLEVSLNNLQDVQGNAIPLEVSLMSSLESIQLNGLGLQADLSSFLPMESLQMLPLIDLNLQANQLSGSIPADISSLRYLRKLRLDRNSLTGALPTEMALLTDLDHLNLHNNPGLSGNIPSEFGMMTRLESLLIDGTSMSGSVPEELCALPSLQHLRVDCTKVECPTNCTCSCQSMESDEYDFSTSP